jgi:repressor LexA
VDKSSNIKERILQIAEFKGIAKEKFFESIGMTYGNFKGKSKLTPINSNAIADIITTYSEISLEWLLTGTGNMLKTHSNKNLLNEPKEKYLSNKKDSEIPLIDIDAMAGYGGGDRQVMEYEGVRGYRVPELENKGVKYFIKVSGSSMYPKYSNGDLLACKPLKDMSFFQWGKPYVLDTEQGAIVKRLFQCPDDDDCLECHSDNKIHYPPFKIPKSSIRALAIVVGVIRLE